MTSHERVVVVGGGLTAARAVEALRESGFDGEVVVYGDEPRLPYERPPLSKAYLQGTDAASVVYPHDTAWYREHRIDVRSGIRVRSIDPAEHTVSISDDEVVRYDRLLLATGASPRAFSGPGASLREVHTLRRLPDSARLRTAFREGRKRVVVVGAGWIGLEAAAAARGFGNDVTVLGRGDVPLASAIGAELGGMFADLHEANGVHLRMGTGVSGLQGGRGSGTREQVTGVVLDSGEVVEADLVLFGIGATPNVELAASAGLHVDDGVVTDEGFRTSAADVFAAGDVASTWNARLGHHLRVEHWANAEHSGRVVGRALAGESLRYDEIPYFYTDQFDLGMEYSGYGELAAGARLVVRGDLAARECIAFWVLDGRVVAGMNVNIWDVNDEVQRIIRSESVVDEAALADPAVPLGTLAGGAT
ncbi:NAD(P)/FAD-dependent oxidoreductase [Agromyces albus]|uniref:NAD(P)/FAD-dependent oxidoreductase n=1 Tax=Agromyces albus TaxID=205332 RepID=UPI002787A756|nr:FAD-dependent oxidoreductase [Agromyces albus]MDQ0576156.1 3-phenylpropionate/trans-cinnamate dioxygenase ferredoxin reductase subunit [Agromyces albus]